MSTAIPALPVDDGTMADIAGRLIELGVVSDEDARWLTQSGLRTHLEDVERDVRSRGYGGGGLHLHSFDRDDEGWATIVYDADAFPNPSSAQRAWEQAHFERERRETEARADDWISRLVALRSTVEMWSGQISSTILQIVERPPITMYEDLMQKYSVFPRKMPVFEVRKSGRPSVKFYPRGLWTLGANGRVDIITSRSSPILVDQSGPLSGPAEWAVFDPSDRLTGRPFTADLFAALVETGLLP